jgi:hypothetical protein
MKKIKETHLHYQKGTSNKVYNVFLFKVSNNKYLVNFAYGRSGSKLREGTKTTNPVDLEQAQKLYDSLVVSKINKEYQVVSGFNSLKQEEKKERESLSSEAYKALLLERLSRAGESETTHTTVSRATGGATGFAALHRGQETITTTAHSLKKVDNYEVSRLIYKAGTLKLEEAKPFIISLYEQEVDNSNAFYYAVVWALGRYRDPSLRPLITSVREKLDESSRYVVEEALFLLREPKELREIEALTLPMPFKSSLNSENLEGFIEQLKLLNEMIGDTYERYKNIDSWYEEDRKAVKNELMPLIQRADEVYLKLYLLAISNSFAYKVIMHTLCHLPINEFNFSLFRRLYKMAEIRDDYEVLAQLITKIESKKMACYTDYDHNWNTKPSIGCSRLYFKKRSLRYLNALALHDERAYIAFSKNILLSMNDYPTEFEAFTTEYYDENWNFKTKQYDAYAVHLTFMSILFGAGKCYMMAPSKKVWEIANKSIHNEHRPERYPKLWDKYPLEVLDILVQSSVEVVQKFAFTILKEHPEALVMIETHQLVPLLSLAYDEARELFCGVAKERYAETKDVEILRAFVLSNDNAIASYGLDLIEQERSLLRLDGLISDITLRTSENIFFRFSKLLQGSELSKEFTDREITVILADTKLSERLYQNRVLQLLKDLEMKLAISHITSLLDDEVLGYRHLFASKLIRGGFVETQKIPLEIKEKIAGYSDSPEMVATTIYLLGQLEGETLMQEHPMLVSFLYHEETTVHVEAAKVIQDLGQEREYAGVLLQSIVDKAFRSANDEVIEIVTETVEKLSLGYEVLQSDQLYRLLIAKSKLANAIGAKVLESQNAENFSVVQWSRLAKNPHKKVREWAYSAYRNNLPAIQKAMPKSLMIFDTHWEDTRAFACAYFENFEPLSTDDVVVIADSNYDDVQNFAKKLIEQREFDNETMLTKLSQHPALTIQRFVTDLMLSEMSVEQLLKMERFFNTLLHSVNTNRVAKTRAMNILNEHLEDREVAEMYARLASHHSATMVWADKTVYTEAMVEIQANYQDIELPLTIEESEVKEVAHGV